MADYQEIPETIRTFLAATGHPWSEDLTDVAAAYSTLVREANDRLRRCGEYLGRGMRSEAVHLADCQPRLLPLVRSLQLPDPAAWARACVANKLAAPPELLVDGLDQLEAAYEAESRFAPLLARHRLLALAKAPVRDRMEVLFPLHENDPGNPVWVEGLQTLGTVRLKQIRTEAQTAYKAKDVPTLAELESELTGRTWHIDVPEDLQRGVSRAAGSLRLEQAKDELRPLLGELRAAHQAGEYDSAKEIMSRWQAIIDVRQLVLPSALQEAIRPLVAWIASEERRQAQNEKMERMREGLDQTEVMFRRSSRRHKLLVILVMALALIITVLLALFYLPQIRIG
jgi:hypothetical protein